MSRKGENASRRRQRLSSWRGLPCLGYSPVGRPCGSGFVRLLLFFPAINSRRRRFTIGSVRCSRQSLSPPSSSLHK